MRHLGSSCFLTRDRTQAPVHWEHRVLLTGPPEVPLLLALGSSRLSPSLSHLFPWSPLQPHRPHSCPQRLIWSSVDTPKVSVLNEWMDSWPAIGDFRSSVSPSGGPGEDCGDDFPAPCGQSRTPRYRVSWNWHIWRAGGWFLAACCVMERGREN